MFCNLSSRRFMQLLQHLWGCSVALRQEGSSTSRSGASRVCRQLLGERKTRKDRTLARNSCLQIDGSHNFYTSVNERFRYRPELPDAYARHKKQHSHNTSSLRLWLATCPFFSNMNSLTFLIATTSMLRSAAAFGSAFVPRSSARTLSTRAFRPTLSMFAGDGQAEVILVGCGAPNRGMGWYHAIQMLEKK